MWSRVTWGKEMKHHPIFETFECQECTGTGQHVFDFLGGATDVAYKKGWEKWAVKEGTSYKPQYPPVNEHYFDWIALLQRVQAASGTFRMAELGAGWAPWLVRAVLAARQVPSIDSIELVGVEADAVHYGWVKDHFSDNGLGIDQYHMVHGAVAPASTILKFPKIANPDEDYGASLRAVNSKTEFVEVQGYTLESLLSKFSGPIDFLHVDIQGAEYDVLPPAMELLKDTVKGIMVGTHISSDKHQELYDLFEGNDWEPILIYPRNETVQTEYGEVQFGDGFQYWTNTRNLDY